MKLIIKYKEEKFDCLLDSEDYDSFKDMSWVYRCGYASRNRTKKDPDGGKWIHLHREILHKAGISIPKGMVVDDINRNRMDNRKCNLRVVSWSENSKNISDESLNKRRQNVKKATAAASLLPRSMNQNKACYNNAKNMNLLGKNIHKGEDNYCSKKVINTETKEVYSCIRDAAEKNGIVYSTLKCRLNGRLKNNTPFIKLSEYVGNL